MWRIPFRVSLGRICSRLAPHASSHAQLWIQAKAVIIVILFSGVATAIVWKVSEFITRGGRINEDLELEGMDIGYHGEHHMVVDEDKIMN